MEGLEYISFQIIASSGTARSYYIEAIQYARNNEFKKAEECIIQADKEYIQAHYIHTRLIQEEAMNQNSEINILLIHALDQMMSAESFGILAREFICLYKKIID